MPGHDVNETTGAIAEATDAVLATLSARLDALLASWQLAIAARRKAPLATTDDVPIRSPSEVLRELERELAGLERRCAEQWQAAEAESNEAEEWEKRAMEAVRNNRDDIARQALTRLYEHSNAAAQLESTATELEAVRDSYRNAVTAVRATTAAGETA
jgi:hypothetical protein